MTFIIRQIATPKPWVQMSKDDAVEACLKDPPAWALRDFTPSSRDGEGLSVYEVEYSDFDDLQVREVAGAFAFHSPSGDISSGNWPFLGVEKERIAAAGLELVTSNGGHGHGVVDARHRDITLRGAEGILRATRLYIEHGQLISIEGRKAADAARDSARRNEIVYTSLFKQSSGGGGRNLLRFVSEQIVIATGRPEKTAR